MSGALSQSTNQLMASYYNICYTVLTVALGGGVGHNDVDYSVDTKDSAQALAGFHVIQDIHVIKGINKKQILEAEIIMDHKIGTMTILYLMKSTKQCLSTRHMTVLLLLSLKIYLDLLLLASHKQNKLCNNIIIYFFVTSTGAKKLLLLQKKQSNILL